MSIIYFCELRLTETFFRLKKHHLFRIFGFCFQDPSTIGQFRDAKSTYFPLPKMGHLATLTSPPSTRPARTADPYGADSSDSLAERGAWGEANFIHGTLACGKIGAKEKGATLNVCIFQYIWNTKDMKKICTHRYIYIYICIYIYVCIYNIYIYNCVYIYILVYIYIYTHPFRSIYIHRYSIYIYMYMHNMYANYLKVTGVLRPERLPATPKKIEELESWKVYEKHHLYRIYTTLETHFYLFRC